MAEPTVAQIIAAYIKERDRRDEIVKKHKQELAVIDERMAKAEDFLLAAMLVADVKSMAGAAGTAYIKERESVTVEDQEAFLNHLKNDDAWQLLDARANKTGVRQYLATTGELPPGVKRTCMNVVQIRRVSK